MDDQSHQLVQKPWNYCNILRDDLSAPDCELSSGRCGYAQTGGLSYLLARGAQASGDYPSAWSILSSSATLRIDSAQGLRTGSEQLTFLLFLKMANRQR